jgi:hypothetical protein
VGSSKVQKVVPSNSQRVGGQEGGELVAPALAAVGVELPAELGQQQGEVPLVLRPDHVAGLGLGAGPLPVQVDAVEDAGRRAGAAFDRAELRQVALDEQVDAGGDERAARGAGVRGVGEIVDQVQPPIDSSTLRCG